MTPARIESPRRPAPTRWRSRTTPSRVSAAFSTKSARRNGASSSRVRWSGVSTGRGSHGPSKAPSRFSSPTANGTNNSPRSSAIYDALVRANADRASTLITFGGGVIGDMAGFAAATYLRGIALVHVPTTLLAQVDSSIGGKVGVNHPLGKNLIGAFYQPHAVVIDPTVLAHAAAAGIPGRTVQSHQVRHDLEPGAIRSVDPRAHRDFRARARGADADHRRVVPASRAAWSRRTSASRGLRRILNFGHTAGHAIEAVTKYRRYRHGEAVAYGMLVAAELATGARRACRA